MDANDKLDADVKGKTPLDILTLGLKFSYFPLFEQIVSDLYTF